MAKKRVHTRSYQLFWQVLGEGERKRLARMLMKVRAEELRGVERDFLLGVRPGRLSELVSCVAESDVYEVGVSLRAISASTACIF